MYIDNHAVQRALAAAGHYSGRIDGDFGPASKAAARKFAASRAPGYHATWHDGRVRIAVEQAIMADATFYYSAIDGITGPATQVAVERWQDFITFQRPSPKPDAGVAAATIWPRQSEMLAFYGKPGTNHERIMPPYQCFYGDQPIKTITLNAKCADSGLRILDRVLAHYGKDQIAALGLDRYGGSYNNRRMRNGTQLSTHAFAAAWDWDPARNALRTPFHKSQFGKPEYAAFIDAHEAEGWISLGRARNMDSMHFQAVRL